ncbi:CDP-glucose 4,6-dehydratase [Sphingomonas pokkalii]|uniref:CDP-glucose 4,6-dehydratase n=1 Tax=Sphingomonas pokkalii TaxID=2175090 RepID=UPI00268D14E1
MGRWCPLESLVTPSFWNNRRVFLTGHTGFKGAWLSLWLTQMGAKVTGFSLPAEQDSLFRQAGVADALTHIEGDIRDFAAVEAAMADADPEVVLHLAAQPLVRLSYEMPVETYATNVQGTVHVLDACRRAPALRAIVCVTSDKCYENREWVWPYRESDPMGGYDPYSSSKGAAELAIAAWRRSFFQNGPALLASGRAGNVIGGGDWAKDRLIPDIIRALIAGDRPYIRSPHAIRPWQHVLDALSGYLLLAERLYSGDVTASTGWNFGPSDDDVRPVDWITDRLTTAWGAPGWDRDHDAKLHEAGVLKLDCSKARTELAWRPALPLNRALEWIVDWHRAVAGGANVLQTTLDQLADYRALLATAATQKESDDRRRLFL